MTNRVRISKPRSAQSKWQDKIMDGVRAADTLKNLLSGMGTDKDKNTFNQFITAGSMGKLQLEAAYRTDWIARKVIDIPAYDSTREWRTWQADKADITKLEELEDKLDIQRKVMICQQRARLYGGAALLIGANQGGAMDQEMDVEKVGADGLKFVHVVSRYELTAGELDYDIASPYYGTPSYYTRTQGGQERIHPSRVIRMVGHEVPDLTAPGADGWGDSILDGIRDAVVAASAVIQQASGLIAESKLDVIKVPELTAGLSNKGYSERLQKRFGLANDAKSIFNLLLLDAQEEWQRIAIPMVGIPDMVKVYLLIASGAADIPATRLLGQSPAGLSATGESDTRNYYDRISADQKTTLSPTLERLDHVLVRSALGADPEELHYEWESLWQMTEKEKAEVGKSKADAHKIDVDAGLIPLEILRDARENQLIEDGVYPGLEQIIEEFGDQGEVEPPVQPGVVLGPDGKPLPPDPNATPPKPGAKGAVPAKGGKVPPKKAPAKKTTDSQDMVDRMRRFDVRKKKPKAMWPAKYNDGRPRSLYVRRDVLNTKDLLAWAREVGFESTIPASEMHVTVMYSKSIVDWSKIGDASFTRQDDKTGQVLIPPGGMRMVEEFDGGAIVLQFTSSSLTFRHCDIKEATGCEYDYPDFQPHITISYKADSSFSNLVAAGKVEPYRGLIVLGPEIFEEVPDEGYTPGAENET